MQTPNTPQMRTNTRQRGAEAERRARRHYLLRGYRVLDANAWAAGNELDLVLRRGRRVVFCEVKQKTGTGFGDPAEMVTAEKQRRLRRAAAAWLAARPKLGGLEVRFDVVAVSAAGVRRIADAF
jgi:putative endonuclease